ncbi:hypothetical protein OH491_19295 [Termitidicoccus mucosus]|uniref:hypothetical protein n=1 Tax=Termitidicoccus mucosus TaxID=1184151 RepID=UPI0011AB3C50
MNTDNQDMRGMTINERLFSSGRLAEWDSALKKKDIDALLKILINLSLTEKEARWTIDSILKTKQE